jgi:hypothetical protein
MNIKVEFDRMSDWFVFKFFLAPYGKWSELRTPFYKDWAKIYLIVGLMKRQIQFCWCLGSKTGGRNRRR